MMWAPTARCAASSGLAASMNYRQQCCWCRFAVQRALPTTNFGSHRKGQTQTCFHSRGETTEGRRNLPHSDDRQKQTIPCHLPIMTHRRNSYFIS